MSKLQCLPLQLGKQKLKKVRMIFNNNNPETFRLAKAAKKKDMKEPEPRERPPWRATAKPIKEPNTNALLKAKLLDASRRALRAMKANSVSCQTDFQPTIVMKEVGFNVQTDLVGQRDVGILTDGTVTIRNIPPGTRESL